MHLHFLPKASNRQDQPLKELFQLRREWIAAELKLLETEAGANFLARTEQVGQQTRFRAIESRYKAQLQTVRKLYDDIDYDPDKPVPITSYRDLRDAITKLPIAASTAVVEYYITDRNVVAAIHLPTRSTLKTVGIRRSELEDIETHWRQGYQRLSCNEDSGVFEPLDPVHWVWAYLSPALDRLKALARATQATIHAWEEKTQKRIRNIAIIPHRFLHLLPLHAIELDDGRLWGDSVQIQYFPSTGVLIQLLEVQDKARWRAPMRTSSKVIAVSYSPDSSPLLFGSHEARMVAQATDGQTLLGNDASPDRVKEAMRDATYVHFACHGRFDSQSPLRTRLDLAPLAPSVCGSRDDERCGGHLTLGEIFKDVQLPVTRLVVLSACETGLAIVERSHDESIGLSTGFLTAGALTVVSSLWPVSDLATCLLMRDFARGIAAGKSPAAALRFAQWRLRQLRGSTSCSGQRAMVESEADPSRGLEMLKEARKLASSGFLPI